MTYKTPEVVFVCIVALLLGSVVGFITSPILTLIKDKDNCKHELQGYKDTDDILTASIDNCYNQLNEKLSKKPKAKVNVEVYKKYFEGGENNRHFGTLDIEPLPPPTNLRIESIGKADEWVTEDTPMKPSALYCERNKEKPECVIEYIKRVLNDVEPIIVLACNHPISSKEATLGFCEGDIVIATTNVADQWEKVGFQHEAYRIIKITDTHIMLRWAQYKGKDGWAEWILTHDEFINRKFVTAPERFYKED